MTILDSARYLSEPLLTPPGQPLRVAVYSRISQGIRSGNFVAGSLLPRETELALALGVSRTVVREALMLLEEDGLISTKRGVGRFVADSASHAMLDELQSIERLLQSPTKALAVVPVEFTLQTVTDIVVELLALEPQAESPASQRCPVRTAATESCPGQTPRRSRPRRPRLLAGRCHLDPVQAEEPVQPDPG